MERPGRLLPGIKVKSYKTTKRTDTEKLIMPGRVVISMLQHDGEPCKPLVKKGDSLKIGQVIGDSKSADAVPVHASISGNVESIIKQLAPDGKEYKAIEIKSDGAQKYSEDIVVPKVTNKDEFVAAIRASGLVGLSGKAVPAYLQYDPANMDRINTLVINGAETDPFVTSDYRSMIEDSREIIAGTKLLMKYLEIDNAHIAIERNNGNAIESIYKIIESENLMNSIHIEILDDIYPQGIAPVLIYNLSGKRLKAGMKPEDLGILLSNVSTVAFLGQYFKTGIPLVSRRVTVAGSAVKAPKNVMVPIGTEIIDVIELCGGYRAEPKKILMGGTMRGVPVLSDSAQISKRTNAILAFSGRETLGHRETACIRCGECAKKCPMGLDPAEIRRAYDKNDLHALEMLGVKECIDCGCCSYLCPARRQLSATAHYSKELLREASKLNE